MSNENFKHHENQEKVEGGLTRTFHGTISVILLCKVTGAGDFEKHNFSLIDSKKLPNVALQILFF